MAMLQDKVVLVTGAGQGIGREIALMMAAHGAKVVVNDVGATLDGTPLEAPLSESVAREIREAGGKAAANADSVADWDGAHRMVKTALDQFGQLDVVVNNAGILRDALFHKMTRDQWEAVVNVHLNGTFYVSRAAAEEFRKQQSGSFVHLTSTAGLFGNIGQANYASAKLGIAGLSKVIALEMQRYNVRSNCIAPAAATRMTQSIPANAPGFENYQSRLIKMPAQSVATLATYLASDAAAMVSGQVLGVRGNEIYFYSQPRLVRTLHRSTGWTPEDLAGVIPPMQSLFEPLIGARDITPWDPL